MEYLHISTRVVHVVLGAFWVGTITFAALFLDPSVREAGPDGGKLMGILQRRGYTRTVLTGALLTVLTGIYLLWRLSGGFSPSFMGSSSGIVLSTGGLAGIIALAIGAHVSVPTARKLGALGQRMAAAEGPPSPEDLSEVARLQGKLTRALRAIMVLVLFALIAMAIGPHI